MIITRQQKNINSSYQKFTRGKDVNKYSAKDLANIFGKKDLEEKIEVKKAVEMKEEKAKEVDISGEPSSSRDNSHGIVTITGGSITDYFKNKMNCIARKTAGDVAHNDKNNSESETKTYVGFGFTGSEQSQKPFESHAYSFENPSLDFMSSEAKSETSRNRKSDFVFENPALDISGSPSSLPRTPKRRKSELAFENPDLNRTYPDSTETAPQAENLKIKKRKKKFELVIDSTSQGLSNHALNLEAESPGKSGIGEFELTRACLGLQNDALDLGDEMTGKKRVTFNDTVEYDTDVSLLKSKKNKKKNACKLDKFEVDSMKLKKKLRTIEVVDHAYINEAMDFETMCQEASENAINERSQKASRKRNRRMSNLETIAEAPEEQRNDTLGETSENLEELCLETPKKKKKNNTNNNKTRSKVTQEGTRELREIVPDTTIDLSDDTENDCEIVKVTKSTKDTTKNETKKVTPDNSTETKSTVNEEHLEPKLTKAPAKMIECVKDKKLRKKKNACEESKENVDKDNCPVQTHAEKPESAKKRKKRNQEKKVANRADNYIEAAVNNEENTFASEEQVIGERPISWDNKNLKGKKLLKTLFIRSPVVHFSGSNINEIKGYGMDFE